MRQDPYNLGTLLGPTVAAMGYELVGVEYHPSGAHALLRVYIDCENGITVDDCAAVSHRISGLLDVEDPIKAQYTLEVSSPGLDRPLFLPEHYDRFVGHSVRLQLTLPLEGRRRFLGQLKAREGEQVILEVDGQELRIPLERIERARLVPKF